MPVPPFIFSSEPGHTSTLLSVSPCLCFSFVRLVSLHHPGPRAGPSKGLFKASNLGSFSELPRWPITISLLTSILKLCVYYSPYTQLLSTSSSYSPSPLLLIALKEEDTAASPYRAQPCVHTSLLAQTRSVLIT